MRNENYYFAYGSNMNLSQMRRRCPNSIFICRARLIGYKFVFDGCSKNRKGAVANIVKSEKEFVWGGVFKITNQCLVNLDKYEEYHRSYQREILEVIDDEGKRYEALVYLREPKILGKPSEKYRQIVLDGAKDVGIPEDYINTYIMANYF